MTLYYNSLDPYSGPLGISWTHNYDIAVKENSDGSVVLRAGDGSRKLYRKSGTGYTSQPGDYSTLTKSISGAFVITKKDGSAENFGPDGKIASISDRNGNAITMTYTGGNLTALSDSAGRITALRYDSTNHITSVIDPSGNTYSFTVIGNTLTSVTYPNSGRWIYTYDSDAFMLTKTDPNGNTTMYTYDAHHRVASSTDPEGKIKSIAYPDPDNIVVSKTTTVTEKDAGVWQYTYDTQAGLLTSKTDPAGGVTSYTYDQNRNMLSKTEPDNTTTTYAYDGNGNMTSITDALGQTTSYRYNSYGQVLSVTDPQGGTTTNTYDAKGNLISTTDATGATTSYVYDSKGNVTLVTNAAGQTTTYSYDQQNNLVSVIDSKGATTTFTYDVSGNITSQTDANGNTTTFTYDSQNHLISVTDPAGNTTRYAYDKNGNKTSMTDANGNVTHYEYNYRGQLIQVKDAMGGITTYAYGSTGCPSCGGGTDKLTLVVDANGNTTKYEYDTLGRKIKDIDALGNVTSYTYDSNGNLLTRTDANGHVTTYTYDPLGRVKEQIDALKGTVNFGYTAKGQISSVTDPLGNTTSYEYDKTGRVVKTISPDTGTTTYTYNPTGTLASKTDANGTTINYHYDSLNRLTTIDFPTDTDIVYTYDTCANGKGRLCGMNDQSGTTSYAYDKLGHVVTETSTILNVTYTTGYSYDKAGNLTTITYPSGRIVEYGFDKLNRTIDVSAALKRSGTLADDIVYDPMSRIKSITLGNGLKETQTYDPDNRIKTITVPGIMSTNYTYDPVGNITSITDQLDPTKSKTYTYDPIDRLASATGPWGSLAWTYDANGNRLTQTNGKKYNYAYDANRLMNITSGHVETFQYDNTGNTVSDETREFVYNQNQRLIKAIENGKTVGEYTYNGKGERVIKKTGLANTNSASNQNTVYHYDLTGKLIEETDGNGKMIAEYVYLNGQPLALIRKQGNSEETFYYHNDHLGTPKVLTDNLVKVVWNIEFDPFGNEVPEKGRQGSYIRSVENNLRFPGQYYDAETGLNYNYYRDYNPVIGRYIEADSIGIKHGINHLYGYVRNNTENTIDPLGLLTVYIWSYRGKTEAWGHASMTLEDGTHISWWPSGVRYDQMPFLPQIYTAEPNPNQTFERDVELEDDNYPDTQIHIDCLDEDAIKRWWSSFKTSNTWRTLTQNCSTTVADGLKAGGAHVRWRDIWTRWNIVWTPSDVEQFATAIRAYENGN